MKTLDRYLIRQLIPVWLWCIVVFVFISCLIDLFEHLDEILRYHIPAATVLQYYASFTPLVFVRASPLALLLSSAFVSTRLIRYQELLAMNAGGISLKRASIPFMFVGWLITLLVFGVNEGVVPATTAVYERLRFEAFRGQSQTHSLENVATLDEANRLYHARTFSLTQQELSDLTVMEHDARNRPVRTFYARRALYTPHGWLLLYGTVTNLGPRGAVRGKPQPFVEQLLRFPVTPESFRQPLIQPETLRLGHVWRLIERLKQVGITNVRRYTVELHAKLAFPFMNLVIGLIGFVGSTRRRTRGHLRGLGTSLGWGILYYIGVAAGQGIGKAGFLPPGLAVWLPHLVAVWCGFRLLRT